ncbi:MAG: hypothetical protein P8Y53_23140, partial [Pseudolabrys sp.]
RVLQGLAAAVAVAGVLAMSAGNADAADWCGFHQKEHSRVRCGYSSLQVCKAKLSDKKKGDKTVTCMPDPANG